MDLGWVLAVSGFAIAIAGTPGPNNTIVAASGANYGFRRTLPFIFGVVVGVAAIMLAVAAVGSSLIADPRVSVVLKWAGVAYLLWLAWRIANARPEIKGAGDGKEPEGKPLSLIQGALLQLVNPKLWAMVAGAVATYGSAAVGNTPGEIAVVFALISGTAAFVSTAAWTMIGVSVGQFIRSERTMKAFNWLMGGLLVASLIPVVAG